MAAESLKLPSFDPLKNKATSPKTFQEMALPRSDAFHKVRGQDFIKY